MNLVRSLGENHVSGGSILNSLYEYDVHFTGAINIDGGVMREICDMGRSFIDSIRFQIDATTIGISNYHGDIFNTDDLKNKFIQFLAYNASNNNRKFIITLPETCTKIQIVTRKTNTEAFKDYLFDKLGLREVSERIPFCFYVYQHLKAADCAFSELQYTEHQPITYNNKSYYVNPGGFTCVGCKESGKNRQVEEGKKYSSISYNTSLNRSEEIWAGLASEGTISFKIHNAGRKMKVVDAPVGIPYPSMDGLSIIDMRGNTIPEQYKEGVDKFIQELNSNNNIDFLVLVDP